MNSKLYVGNLSPAVSEQDLRVLFSRAGAVTAVELMLVPVTRQSRGFAFVTMATPELAAAALSEFHGCEIGGRHITVTEARPPQQPQGLISEGFNFPLSGPFRPDARQSKNRNGPVRRGRRGARGR